MSDLPPLTALRSFEAVARLGSISQAASELHVTHSAISQQIKLLENLLGLALFVREGRGLRLSENGRFYALQVRASLGEIADATRVVRARPREGELVVTVMPSFGLNWLLPRLPRFRERHPHCRVRLVASLDVQNLRQGLADLGVRIGKGDWEGVGRERLFDDELLMVAAPDFNGGRLPRTPSEIVACPTLRSTESWALWCQRAGVAEPQHGLLINDSNLLLEAVRLGQGIALERRSLVAGALAEGRLVQLGDIRVPYPYPYWLVWPQREPPSDRHQAFADWLREEARRYHVGGGREIQLLEDLRGVQLIAQGRHRRPQALAVLLAGQHRHVQCAGHAQQPLAVLDQRRAVVDGRQQAFLDIDHQQGRGCGADQHGVLLRFDVSVRLA